MGINSPTQDQPSDENSLPSERRVVERLRSGRVGDSTVRIARPNFDGFTRLGKGRLEANLTLEEPRDPVGRLRRFLLGSPIQSQNERHERISKKKALAVFSSDALSSVAYAPQETLLVLLAAGAAGLAFSLPISIAVVTLLAIVVTSYRQTIYAYPKGGGSYIVAHRNLGPTLGLIAASALIVGYILTVSVSIASAVDQLIAAAPMVGAFRVPIGVVIIGLVTLANLRGLRESASIFAIPTYIFLVSMFALIGVGLFKAFSGTLVIHSHAEIPAVLAPVSVFLILRAFAVGSAVMTRASSGSPSRPREFSMKP